MFITNEIVEDCNCIGRDVIQDKTIQSLPKEETDSFNMIGESDRMEIERENEENLSIEDSYVENGNVPLEDGITVMGEKKKNLKVDPLKLKRLYQVKTNTPKRLVLAKKYEIMSRGEKLNQRRLLTKVDEPKTVDKNLDINKFGGSHSSETWNKIIDAESKDEILGRDNENKIEEARFVDLGESMQVEDDSTKQNITDEASEEDVNQTKDGNYPVAALSQMLPDDDDEMKETPYKALEYQLYDSLQCPNCEEDFENRAAFNKHKNDCKVTSYACTKCGVNFMSRSGLKSHVNAIHAERNKIQDKVKKLAAKNRK